MNFSNEEIYSMYGQYDKFVRIEFEPKSEAFEKYGASLMGVFKYVKEERDALVQALKQQTIPRTEKKTLFLPSELEILNAGQIEDLDKNGILCSEIDSISSTNLPKSNRYSTKGIKDLPPTVNIEIDSSEWQDINRIKYGFLKSRYSKGNALSPSEFEEYLGLRTYYNDNVNDEKYKKNALESDGKTVKEKVRFHELKSKFTDGQINADEMLDYVIMVSVKTEERQKVIKAELQRSGERLSELVEKYGDKIENLEKICSNFNDRVLLYGEKLIYLDFERFVHIYAGHVKESLVSDKYSGNTIFQYKYDDIIRLLTLVLTATNTEIQTHFKTNPTRSFIRRGARSINFDGNYYRVDIDENGRLLTFHPYNTIEDKNNDLDETVTQAAQ